MHENRLRNSRELIRVAERITQLEELVYFIATRVSLIYRLNKTFEVDDLTAHIKELSDYLIQQSAEHNIEQELQEAVRRQMENNQREYFLNEKMKAIKSELDLHEERERELWRWRYCRARKRLAEADLPETVRKSRKWVS